MPHPHWQKTAVLALLFVGTFSVNQGVVQGAQALKLKRGLIPLLHAAERNYPGLDAIQHKIAAAEAKLGEAWVSPFFQFEVTGAFGLAPEAQGTPVFSPNSELPLGNSWAPVTRVGIEGAVPLWTFGKLGAARDAARAGVKASKHEEAQVRARLYYDVKRAYYALQLSLDALQMVSEGRGRLHSAVESLEKRIEAGDPDANEMDRWRLSSTVSEIEGRTADAHQLEASSRQALRVLTGLRDINEQQCPAEVIDFQPRPLGWYQQAARLHRPEIQMLLAGLDARRAQADLAEASYFPDLALALSMTYGYAPGIDDQNNPFVVDRANTRGLTAGLVARWSLDFWGNAYREENADELLLQTRFQGDEAMRGVITEVSAVYYELQSALSRESAWQNGHHDTRAWFLSAAQAYQVGTIEPRDLVDAIRAYFTARFNHMTAIRDFNSAAANLERVVGTPLMPLARWERPCE
ncbi:MAG: TolC family protein [Myxococcales bacterium]|nr:TolC family protein [Myxococcales bacterium]